MNKKISRINKSELKKLSDILPEESASYVELAIDRTKNKRAPRIPIFNTRESGASSLLDNDCCK